MDGMAHLLARKRAHFGQCAVLLDYCGRRHKAAAYLLLASRLLAANGARARLMSLRRAHTTTHKHTQPTSPFDLLFGAGKARRRGGLSQRSSNFGNNNNKSQQTESCMETLRNKTQMMPNRSPTHAADWQWGAPN